MIFHILSIFPQFFTTPLQTSILKRANEKKLVEFDLLNIREFAQDKHKTTDDRPFGGDPGMVMKIEPIELALRSIGKGLNQPHTPNGRVVLLSARGKRFDQNKAREYSKLESLSLICGHYADVDQRVAKYLIDEELSIGEFVLTGGEPAALVILDAVVRLLPGVLGNESSLLGESHDQPGRISPPQYTRPADYLGLKVPEVLLTGNPKKIQHWQKQHLGFSQD